MKKTLVAISLLTILALTAQTTFAACKCKHLEHIKNVHNGCHEKLINMHKNCPLCKKHKKCSEKEQNQTTDTNNLK